MAGIRQDPLRWSWRITKRQRDSQRNCRTEKFFIFRLEFSALNFIPSSNTRYRVYRINKIHYRSVIQRLNLTLSTGVNNRLILFNNPLFIYFFFFFIYVLNAKRRVMTHHISYVMRRHNVCLRNCSVHQCSRR